MGCNCGGSGGKPAPQLTRERETPRRDVAPRRPRVGGPGQPGYYYTGPRRDKPAQ